MGRDLLPSHKCDGGLKLVLQSQEATADVPVPYCGETYQACRPVLFRL